MIENRIIVCLASSWDYDPTSKHQLMKVLARKNDILWVDYHGSRRPAINRHDAGAAFSALKRFTRGLRRVAPSIYQITPLVVPGAKRPLTRWLHHNMLASQIKAAIRKMGGRRKPIQVWSFAPDVPALIGRLHEECFVYYCVDDYTHFDGFDHEHIIAEETKLIQRSGLVVTTSEPLLEAKRKLRADIQLMRHGVDYDHFASSWRTRLARPSDLRDIPQPIFGFFGLVQHWIDCDLLAEVASRRPHYSFVVIGDCKVDVSMLHRLPNVHLLGRRPYESLPAYCAAFRAGLMPFALNAMTRSVNPIKMHEYLAAGLSVVSTPLPEARRYSDPGPIHIADTAEAFADACDAALIRETSTSRQQISAMVEAESWSARVDTLSEWINARCIGATVPKSAPAASIVRKEEVADFDAGCPVPGNKPSSVAVADSPSSSTQHP